MTTRAQRAAAATATPAPAEQAAPAAPPVETAAAAPEAAPTKAAAKGDKAGPHRIIKRLRGLLITGTNPDDVQGVIDELVKEYGEPEASKV